MADRKTLEALIQNIVPECTSWFLPANKVKPKQIKNAIAKYARGVSEGSVVALMDTTMFKSGKEGFLLTEQAIYVKMLHPASFPLDGIRSVTFNDDCDVTITYHDGNTRGFFANIYAEDICKLLTALIQSEPAPKASAPVKAPVPKAAEAEKAPAPPKAPAPKAAESQIVPVPKKASPPLASNPKKESVRHDMPKLDFDTVRLLAESGKEDAMYELARMYKQGVGVPQSDELSSEWTHKAALAGYEPAFVSLAILYMNKRQTLNDYLSTEYWLKKAILQGNYPVENTLANITRIIKESYLNHAVGDIIPFGKYYEDRNSNKLDTLYWRVIAKEGNRLLVIANHVIDYLPFFKWKNDVMNPTWEESDLRQWLHTEFWNIAFREIDTSYIAETVVQTNPSPDYPLLAEALRERGTAYRNNPVGPRTTRDRLFFLSMEDVIHYFYNDKTPELNSYVFSKRPSYIDNSINYWFNSEGSEKTWLKTNISLDALNQINAYKPTQKSEESTIERDKDYIYETLCVDWWLRNNAALIPDNYLSQNHILTVSAGINFYKHIVEEYRNDCRKYNTPINPHVEPIACGSIDKRNAYMPAGVRPAMWLDFSD